MNYDGGGGGGGIKIQLMHPIMEEVQRYANIWRFADLTKDIIECGCLQQVNQTYEA